MDDIRKRAQGFLEYFADDWTYTARKGKELAQAVLSAEQTTVDPDMTSQQLRLHMGEMTAQEERTARAAIRWANSARMQPVTAQEFAKAIDEVRLCISSSRRGGNGLRNANDLYEALGRAGIRLVRE